MRPTPSPLAKGMHPRKWDDYYSRLVPTEPRLLTVENYKEFLQVRSVALAEAANAYFAELSRG